VWQKKLEKEGKSDLAQAELEKIQKTKMMESKVHTISHITIVCTRELLVMLEIACVTSTYGLSKCCLFSWSWRR